MKQQVTSQASEQGATLVVTLIVCVVLSMVVVALMQNATLDRSSAKSLANSYRAQLAAESGLGVAMGSILLGAGADRSFIVSETNHAPDRSPVLLVGTNEASISTNMVPLISGPLEEYLTNRASIGGYLGRRASTNSADTVDINGGANSFIQQTNSGDWFRAPWVYVTNVTGPGPSGIQISRYAYLVVDEQARLNPFYHRGLQGAARTNFGASAVEIRVNRDGARVVDGASALQSILDASNSIYTPQTVSLIAGTNFAAVKHLLSIHRVVDEDTIPAGYISVSGGGTNFVAYADAGKPKYNLNDLATNATHGAAPADRALKIAGIISSNLPEFFQRDAGSRLASLTNTIYPTRIAASIVDYIDGDVVPTTGLGGEPAGQELAPYAVMVAERNTWVSEQPPPPASNNITVEIQTQFFVQLWNPHTVPVEGAVGLQVRRRQYVELPNGGPQTDFNDYLPPPVTLNPPLQPNEMRAIAFAPDVQQFVHPTSRPSAAPANYPRWPQTSSAGADLTGHPQFRLTWDGALLQMNRQGPEMPPPANSGLVKSFTGNNFGPVGVIRWGFNFCPPNPANTVGDPRATFTVETDWATVGNIASAMWQGRQTDTGGRRQDFLQLWSARDYVRANISQGTPLASSNANPLAIPSTYQPIDARSAPSFLRNSAMLTVGELGNIFDPAQADNSGTSLAGASQGFFRPAGGRSLRVGQPESLYWDEGGRRAIQLLDLFTVNPLGTNTAELGSTAYTNVPVMRGRININTASKPVLASVFEELALTADQGIASAVVDASKIADAIITNRPYSRISDLYKAVGAFADGSNYNPQVPNVSVTITNALAGSSADYVAMAAMDRAREELLARSVNLLGTQSRAFRVFVVGEALDSLSNPLSRASLEASIQLQPRQGQAGFSQQVRFKKFQ